MSRRSAKVARALREAPVREGMAKVIQAAAQRHIAESEGRKGPFKELKRLHGLYVKRTLNSKKLGERQMMAMQAGFRNGGVPLRNTGRGMNSLRGKCLLDGKNLRIRIRGERYMAYHEHGFTTRGPNFIPLTKKGARLGSKAAAIKAKHRRDGEDAGDEPLHRIVDLAMGLGARVETAEIYDRLVYGKDYIMAWRGVTVPARPFMAPTRPDLRTFGRTTAAALKVVLKGR